MRATPPFACEEYTFRQRDVFPSNETNPNYTNLAERKYWVGDDCGILCSGQYSLTNCLECVQRQELIKTGKLSSFITLHHFAIRRLFIHPFITFTSFALSFYYTLSFKPTHSLQV